MKKIIAVIPIRSGSKGIIDKNIMDFNGKPLVIWTIEQAKKVKEIDKIIVSTDSDLYAKIVWKYANDIEIIMRPKEISKDDSLDIDCFKHVLKQLKYYPDILIHLRATYPTRKPADIKKALDLFLQNKNATSLRSVTKSNNPIWKKYFCHNGIIYPAIGDIYDDELHNKPRQELKPDYWHNGCIDIVTRETIEKGSMSGNVIIPYFMDEAEIKDIDTIEEAENISINENFATMPSGKTFVFDIDGCICTNTDNYLFAIPIQSTIDLINKLYENDNKIILFSARGTKTGIDWNEITKVQLYEWNIKYHELKFGKPAADFYVDDKFINLNLLKKELYKK